MLTNKELAELLAKAAVALQAPGAVKPKDVDAIVADLLVESTMRQSERHV